MNAKISAQVNDLAPASYQRLGKFGSHTMRECQKSYLGLIKNGLNFGGLKSEI